MSDHWYYCPNLRIGENTLPADEAHHALRVMRVRGGDSLTLFDGAGNVGVGVARADSGGDAIRANKKASSLVVEIREVLRNSAPSPKLTIITAACKGPRMTTLVEKCTELGVSRIVIAGFARSVVKVSSNGVEKLQRTALEACKQSRRPWLPEIRAAANGVDGLTKIAEDPLVAGFIANPTPGASALSQAVRNAGNVTAIAVAIGPEGGFTDDEVEAMQKYGAQAVTLTPYILRVETAAVCAASVVMCRDESA
ncbi:MAG: 16S rRNA (uracil(1498)-N(3))-methyltransferase [Phycisphaerae bacterium]